MAALGTGCVKEDDFCSIVTWLHENHPGKADDCARGPAEGPGDGGEEIQDGAMRPAQGRMRCMSRQAALRPSMMGRERHSWHESLGIQAWASVLGWRCSLPAMERIHPQPLSDDELRPQLEAMATVLFDGQTVEWDEIEQQVERLGFGDLYIVSCTQGRSGNGIKIRLKPFLALGLTAQISDASACVAGV